MIGPVPSGPGDALAPRSRNEQLSSKGQDGSTWTDTDNLG